MAERTGQRAIAVFAWHGRRASATPEQSSLTGLCATVDCEFSRMALDHATALTAGDAAGLHAIAERLGAASFQGAAVDVAEQAQRIVK